MLVPPTQVEWHSCFRYATVWFVMAMAGSLNALVASHTNTVALHYTVVDRAVADSQLA